MGALYFNVCFGSFTGALVQSPTKYSPTEDLQNITWLVHTLEDPPSTIHTPMVSTTPQQEWITLDIFGDTYFLPPVAAF